MIISPEVNKIFTIPTQAALQPIIEEYGVSLLILFGSQATGKTHQESDVDIGFLSARRLRPREIADLAYALSQVFKIASADLTDLRDAPPLLLKNIAVASRLLYEREPQIGARFKIYAAKLFMEAKALLAAREASLRAFLQTP